MRFVLVGVLAVSACAPVVDGGAGSTRAAQSNCVHTEKGRRCFEIKQGLAITGGDVVLGSAEKLAAEAGKQQRGESSYWDSGATLWPGGVVPYEVAQVFSGTGMNRINDAVADYAQHTGIRWVPRNGETDYVVFTTGGGCYSNLGKVGGPQELHLDVDASCAPAHEMGHALGLEHEHQRPDRDNYLIVNYGNLDPQYQNQLDIIPGEDASSAFDVSSVMEYYSYAFSANGGPTLVKRDGSAIPYAYSLSGEDVSLINEHYAKAPPIPPSPGQCGIMNPGEGLGPNGQLWSCDGRFVLVLQSDGNLVEYGPGGAAWATGTRTGYVVVMQGDGNLVEYTGGGQVAWSPNTWGHGGAYLALQSDGNLVVYQNGQALWADGVSQAAPQLPPTPPRCTYMNPGEGLGPGASLTSCDGRFVLVMQGDGNLVLYQNGVGALWSTATNGRGYYVIMQGDGNLVVYDNANHPVWASNTTSYGAYLALQTDGNLVLYQGSSALWSTGTCCR